MTGEYTGRPVERIDRTLRALQALWLRQPDIRLGQLIMSLNGGRDPFYLEDEQLLTLIRAEIAEYRDGA